MKFVSYVTKTAIGIISVLTGIALFGAMHVWGEGFNFYSSMFVYFVASLLAVAGVYVTICASREYNDYLDECDRIVEYQ